jgi:hypothetical protein
MEYTDHPLVGLSERLLYAVKVQSETQVLVESLKKVTEEDLLSALKDDQEKLVFWINLYNAFYQIIRTEELVDKKDIYKSRIINIAGHDFSLDDIEHGVLRQYRYKYSLGYLTNPFTKKMIKDLAVDKLDWRIHFALNCGAKSCPPIAFYRLSSIDAQLEMATSSFLNNETTTNEKSKSVEVTALFKWFKNDFGGNDGIRQILTKYLDKDFSEYTLRYADYSWDDNLNNFID